MDLSSLCVCLKKIWGFFKPKEKPVSITKTGDNKEYHNLTMSNISSGGDVILGDKKVYVDKRPDILAEYEEKRAALVEKGELNPSDLYWRVVREDELNVIRFLNGIAPSGVVYAYRSEEFKRGYHQPTLIFYLVKIQERGKTTRIVNGREKRGTSPNNWPYYLLTVNLENGELMSRSPREVETNFSEAKRTSTMTSIEKLFETVKEKAGDPHFLLG